MVISFLTYLLFFLTPLFVVPGFYLSFEPPKVLLSELLIAVMIAYAIFSGNFSFKKVNRNLLFLTGGFFLLSLLHLILDPTRGNLFGNIFRLQGTILFWHLLIFALIAQSYWFSLKDKYIYMSGFLAIILASFSFGTNSAGRWIGTLGEPNALGAVAIFVFPFVFLSFKQIWIKIISVILVLIVMNFSESKSALIGLGLELWFIFLVKVVKVKYLWATATSVVIVLWSLGLPILEQRFFLSTNTDPYAYRFEDRAEIWRVAVNSGIDSPIFGSGLESVQSQIRNTAKEMNVNAQYQIIDSSHNLILDYWIWGGIVGVALILAIILFTFKNLIQKKLVLETTVFIGLLTVLFFNPTTVTILAGFWWIVGRSFAKHEDS